MSEEQWKDSIYFEVVKATHSVTGTWPAFFTSGSALPPIFFRDERLWHFIMIRYQIKTDQQLIDEMGMPSRLMLRLKDFFAALSHPAFDWEVILDRGRVPLNDGVSLCTFNRLYDSFRSWCTMYLAFPWQTFAADLVEGLQFFEKAAAPVLQEAKVALYEYTLECLTAISGNDLIARSVQKFHRVREAAALATAQKQMTTEEVEPCIPPVVCKPFVPHSRRCDRCNANVTGLFAVHNRVCPKRLRMRETRREVPSGKAKQR